MTKCQTCPNGFSYQCQYKNCVQLHKTSDGLCIAIISLMKYTQHVSIKDAAISMIDIPLLYAQARAISPDIHNRTTTLLFTSE